jgi:NADH-quinone oxidoreductase subunit J
MLVFLFILFGAMAIGCALAMVAQRNPLYSAISLIGVFISLACLYVMLAAPFIAAVQVIVYAGAISCELSCAHPAKAVRRVRFGSRQDRTS